MHIRRNIKWDTCAPLSPGPIEFGILTGTVDKPITVLISFYHFRIWSEVPQQYYGDSNFENDKNPLNPYFDTSIFCDILTQDLVCPWGKCHRGTIPVGKCVKLQNLWWWHVIRCAHDDVIKFSALLAICAGNSPVTGEFPAQRPVNRGIDIFFDLCLNKRLSKQSQGW